MSGRGNFQEETSGSPHELKVCRNRFVIPISNIFHFSSGRCSFSFPFSWGCSPLVLPNLVRRWAVLERRSAWFVVGTQVKACSREIHSFSRACKYTDTQGLSNNTYTRHCCQQWPSNTTPYRMHTVGLRSRTSLSADCGRPIQSWLILQSPHCLRNDLKCVKWDVNHTAYIPYTVYSYRRIFGSNSRYIPWKSTHLIIRNYI